MAKEVLLLSKEESYLVDKDASKDFNTNKGIIKASLLRKKKIGDIIKTHMGKEFVIVKPTILDIIAKKIKRSAQVILPKDIALMLAYTGIRPDSKVIDIGTGTGYLSIFLANFLSQGKIITYEKDKRFYKTAKDNISKSGLNNVTIRFKDATKGLMDKEADLVTIDIQTPEKVIKHAYSSLRIGGYLVVYAPIVEELMRAVKAIEKLKFNEIKTIENIVREWQTERTTRPKTMGLMHTGFITFARKAG